MSHITKEEFLGDGLYVYNDGFSLCLRAPRPGGDHEVWLEPVVFVEFLRYAKRVGMCSDKWEMKT